MSSVISCIFCDKICKSSDSRPHPNSKSKDRIHNKCLIKKNLVDKNGSVRTFTKPKPDDTGPPESTISVHKDVQNDPSLREAIDERLMKKLEEGRLDSASTNSPSQFFFDLKAGIVKPHEKQRYLQHRNVCEIAARYDDNGFQEEAAGRAYNHAGKDLNTLGDSDEEDDQRDDKVHDERLLKLTQLEAYARDRDSRRSSGEKRKHGTSTDRGTKKLPRINLDETNPCWFCLSSPKVEKHLIIAIGEHCYLTLAKGGLVDEHLLIIPIEHIPDLNDTNNSEDLLQELGSFKRSLVRYFGCKSQGVVFYERNFRSLHWQVQVVPIPMDSIDELEENIKSISHDHFKNANYLDIPAGCQLSDILPPGTAYLFWQLEPLGVRFVTEISVKGCFFPVQIGRITLADPKILNCQDRIDWKSCCKTEDDYKELVAKVKEAYRDHDIT